MSEWITDRRPTVNDAHCGFVWITTKRGDVFREIWKDVRDEPWMPITPPEPYVKPKLQRYIVVPGKRDDRFLELQECEAAFDSAVCMSDDVKHIEAIHAELLEACEGLLGLAERHGWLHVAVNQARAAIAKAKGEQP